MNSSCVLVVTVLYLSVFVKLPLAKGKSLSFFFRPSYFFLFLVFVSISFAIQESSVLYNSLSNPPECLQFTGDHVWVSFMPLSCPLCLSYQAQLFRITVHGNSQNGDLHSLSWALWLFIFIIKQSQTKVLYDGCGI